MPQDQKGWSSDRELVEQILGGSASHFELLYETYFPRVYRFALKRLGDPGEAEDVTQEVFFSVFSCLDRFQGESALLVWIFGITRNTVNRRFRKQRPRLEPIDGDSTREPAAADVPAEQAVTAIRFSLGHESSSDDIVRAAELVPGCVDKVRKLSGALGRG